MHDRGRKATVANGSLSPRAVAGKLRPDISLAARSAKGPPPPLWASVTADELGGLLGIAARTVRELATRGVLVKAARGRYDAPASIASYCRHLREIAAGRVGDAQPGLTSERARQAREQARWRGDENAIPGGNLGCDGPHDAAVTLATCARPCDGLQSFELLGTF